MNKSCRYFEKLVFPITELGMQSRDYCSMELRKKEGA